MLPQHCSGGAMPPMVLPVSQPSYLAGMGPFVCTSYQKDLCTLEGGMSCTAEEAAAGVWQQFYHHSPASDCRAMQEIATPGLEVPFKARQVTCCITGNFNAPPAGNVSVQVLDVPTAPTVPCYTPATGIATGTSDPSNAAGNSPGHLTTGNAVYLATFNTSQQPSGS
jgi:hypothetical protein